MQQVKKRGGVIITRQSTQDIARADRGAIYIHREYTKKSACASTSGYILAAVGGEPTSQFLRFELKFLTGAGRDLKVT